MKPIRLKMTAFGAYAGTVDLDFERGLAGEKIFLIHGATGAGKTTILDAICYALYDESSGDERTDKMMRSQQAVNATTEVEFEFSLGELIYKIRRNPKIEKPRGVADIDKAAELYRGGKIIAVGAREVNNRVKEILGFAVEQFRQVILLPQGAFKKFLVADSDDRQKVLNVIFDANFYGLLEERLKETAALAKKSHDELVAQQKNLLDNAREIGNVQTAKDFPALQSSLEENLSGAQSKLAALENNFNKATENLNACQNKIAELQKIRDVFNQIAAAKDDLKAARKAEAFAQEILNSKQRELDAYRKRLDALKQQEADLQGADTKALTAQQLLKDAQERDSISREIERLQQKSAEVQRNHSKAAENLQAAQNYLKELQALQKKCTAAKLAESLADGEPCPVCGSTNHPQPAFTDKIIPSDEQIERAENIIQKRQLELDAANKAVTSNSEKIKSQQDLLKKFEGAPKIPDAQKSVDAAKILADKLEDCRQRLRKGERLLREVEAKIEAARIEVDSKKNLSAKLHGQLTEKINQVPAEYQTPEKLDADLTAAESCRKNLEATKTSAQNLYKAALAEVTTLKNNLARLQKISERLDNLDAEIHAADKNYSLWKKLSDVANGTFNSNFKVSFQRYYLNAIFKDIIFEANEYLDKMSGGRYRFQNRERAVDRRKATGLDLEILDAYTSTARDVKTLSGGESFLASLSLALGLAAVVKNLAGGIKLDTIFIDEGFGSLDNETLDVALNALMDLQSGGRLVGIISHVDELKRRVPVRLEVTKNKSGSTAKFVS